jgi:DNA-binding transcriptional ArsR family regulator
MFSMPFSQDRRPATADELKAMGHPLRMRILRLCLDESRTNKELADLLGKDPATILHHVRMLVDHGFLRAEAPRTGARGALEKPYRATGLSWRLDLLGDTQPELARQVELAVIDAYRAELAEALDDLGPGALQLQTRAPLRLNERSREELRQRYEGLLADFLDRDDADGERLSLFVSLHVRRSTG